MGYYQFFVPQEKVHKANVSDSSFGWKIPIEELRKAGQVTDSGAYSSIRKQGTVAMGLPVRLKIPTIGVDTAIEDAYITPEGRMDVPAGSVNVAWYALGPRPGEPGNAVIGGHFGIDNGVPKVFYDLNKLVVGDRVYVVNDKNDTLAFVVKSISLFERNDDSTPVFVSRDNLAHLNVITCEGIWNQVNDSYPSRRVVFTDAIPSNDPAVIEELSRIIVTPKAVATISPSPDPAFTTAEFTPLQEPVATTVTTVSTPSAEIETTNSISAWEAFWNYLSSFWL